MIRVKMPEDEKQKPEPRPEPSMFPPREGQVVEVEGMGKRVWRKNEAGMMVLVPVTEH